MKRVAALIAAEDSIHRLGRAKIGALTTIDSGQAVKSIFRGNLGSIPTELSSFGFDVRGGESLIDWSFTEADAGRSIGARGPPQACVGFVSHRDGDGQLRISHCQGLGCANSNAVAPHVLSLKSTYLRKDQRAVRSCSCGGNVGRCQKYDLYIAAGGLNTKGAGADYAVCSPA